MNYFYNGYIFDSNRFLIYNATTDTATIDLINQVYDSTHTTTIPQDMQMDSTDMSMDKIAINRAGICLSYNCNLRCNYCAYSSDEQNTNKLQLSDVKLFINDIIMRRTIKKLLEKTNEPLEIDFTGGGEPTYDWDLFKDTIQFIRQQCSENSIPVYLRLVTNGMLSSAQLDFISNNLDHVMISYDGLPETQSRNRINPHKKNTNVIVENSIQQLAMKGVPLTVRSTIWQNDFDKMIDMYHHVFSLFPPKSSANWSVLPVLFEGRAIAHIKHQGKTTYSKFLSNCLKLVNHIISTEGEEKLKAIDMPLFNNNLCEIFCGAHRIIQPWLLPDKSIVTCIESRDDKVSIGKICNDGVHYYKKYQDKLLEINQKKYNECQDCVAYRVCRGGCPLWHIRVDDEIQEPLECCLQKEYWIYTVNALISGEFSFGWKLEKISLPRVENKDIYKVTREAI